MPRQQRVGGADHADRQDQRRRERRLDHEQLRHAADVLEDPAPLGDARRDRLEVVLHEHDVGHAAGDLGARAERHRQPGGLHRGDVVDAVADHRGVPAAASQRLHERLLLVGCDAGEDGVRRGHLLQLGRVGRQVGAGHARGVRKARRARDGDHRAGRVARHHLQVDALAAQVRHDVARLRAHLLAQHGQPERDEPGRIGGHGGGAVEVRQRRRVPEHEHARTLALAARHLRGERPGTEHLGGAQHQHLVGERRAGPLPARRERHLGERLLGRAAERRGDRVGRRRADAAGRRHPRQRLRAPPPPGRRTPPPPRPARACRR